MLPLPLLVFALSTPMIALIFDNDSASKDSSHFAEELDMSIIKTLGSVIKTNIFKQVILISLSLCKHKDCSRFTLREVSTSIFDLLHVFSNTSFSVIPEI